MLKASEIQSKTGCSSVRSSPSTGLADASAEPTPHMGITVLTVTISVELSWLCFVWKGWGWACSWALGHLNNVRWEPVWAGFLSHLGTGVIQLLLWQPSLAAGHVAAPWHRNWFWPRATSARAGGFCCSKGSETVVVVKGGWRQPSPLRTALLSSLPFCYGHNKTILIRTHHWHKHTRSWNEAVLEQTVCPLLGRS